MARAMWIILVALSLANSAAWANISTGSALGAHIRIN